MYKPPGDICVRVCASTCVSVVGRLSILFRIYANQLNILHLYTHQYAFIFVM